MDNNAIYSRTALMMGSGIMEKLSATRVIIFGVGGVGSWCAEGLLRNGITHLTLVDSDTVCVTNINRQLMATCRTVGCPKVDALKERLLDINPQAEINALKTIYSAETAEEFDLDSYDYVIDAIDSLKDKADLISRASSSKATVFSSMGASLKVDPTKIKVADIWDVKGCPLGFALRKKMRRSNLTTAKPVLCVYDDEVLANLGAGEESAIHCNLCPEGRTANPETASEDHVWCAKKAATNGTTAHITAIFGFTLCGLVIKDIYTQAQAMD